MLGARIVLYCWPRTLMRHTRKDDMPMLYDYVAGHQRDIRATSKLFDECFPNEDDAEMFIARFLCTLEADDCFGVRLAEIICIFTQALMTCKVMKQIQRENEEDILLSAVVNACVRQLCVGSQTAKHTMLVMNMGMQLLW